MFAAPACKESRVAGLSLRAGGREFPPATMNVDPSYLENRRKIEPKEIPSCLIPRLRVKFTR